MGQPQVADNFDPFQRGGETFEDARIDLLLIRTYPLAPRPAGAAPRPDAGACNVKDFPRACVTAGSMISRAILDADHGYTDRMCCCFAEAGSSRYYKAETEQKYQCYG